MIIKMSEIRSFTDVVFRALQIAVILTVATVGVIVLGAMAITSLLLGFLLGVAWWKVMIVMAVTVVVTKLLD